MCFNECRNDFSCRSVQHGISRSSYCTRKIELNDDFHRGAQGRYTLWWKRVWCKYKKHSCACALKDIDYRYCTPPQTRSNTHTHTLQCTHTHTNTTHTHSFTQTQHTHTTHTHTNTHTIPTLCYVEKLYDYKVPVINCAMRCMHR